MIGELDIEISAKRPIFPLQPFFAFRTSQSALKLVGLPKAIGSWNIDEVFVEYTYPDGVTHSVKAEKIGKVYVATLEASEVGGDSKNGLAIVATGSDEKGDPTQYIVAKGDIKILESDGSVEPTETVYTLHYFDEQPENPRKGDTYLDDGWLRIYDGSNWSQKPEIEVPTKVSELENDVPYASNGQILDIEDEIDSIQQDLDETIGRVDALRGEVDTLTEDSERMNQLINGMSMSIQDIEHKIPDQATSDNQLADKDFVNSSIATNTANFKGTFNSVDELPTDGVTTNDYAFVIGQDSEGNTTYERYKFNGSDWAYEYTLNNSSFTANQWAAINSGVTQQFVDTTPNFQDIINLINDQPNLTLSGEYEDGTEFSFDVVTKN